MSAAVVLGFLIGGLLLLLGLHRLFRPQRGGPGGDGSDGGDGYSVGFFDSGGSDDCGGDGGGD